MWIERHSSCHTGDQDADFDGGLRRRRDLDHGGTHRVDLESARHFGIAAGCTMLYPKLTDTAANRDFSVEQTLHGPAAGLGFYF